MSKEEQRAQLARDIQGVHIRVYPPEEPDMFDSPIPWQREQYPRKVYHGHAGSTPVRRRPNYDTLLDPPISSSERAKRFK